MSNKAFNLQLYSSYHYLIKLANEPKISSTYQPKADYVNDFNAWSVATTSPEAALKRNPIFLNRSYARTVSFSIPTVRPLCYSKVTNQHTGWALFFYCTVFFKLQSESERWFRTFPLQPAACGALALHCISKMRSNYYYRCIMFVDSPLHSCELTFLQIWPKSQGWRD